MPRGRNSPQATEHNTSETSVRVDKWLWAARFYKTRSLATEAIDAGHVRVNEQRYKPGRLIRVGDVVQINRNGDERELVVQALSLRRGPASEAQGLYEETPLSIERRAAAAALRDLAPSPDGAGRPTKRDRRNLQRLRESS